MNEFRSSAPSVGGDRFLEHLVTARPLRVLGHPAAAVPLAVLGTRRLSSLFASRAPRHRRQTPATGWARRWRPGRRREAN